MLLRIFIFKAILLSFMSTVNCQSHNYELLLGINTSNVIHARDGQQILYSHTLNSPLWNIGGQFGLARTIKINEGFYVSIGLRLQIRGDKSSLYEVLPEKQIHSMRFIYLMMPINVSLKLLDNKNIFIKGGLSPDYLLKQNKIGDYVTYFPTIDSFKDKLGLTIQTGFGYDISERVYSEIMYSQSLTNIISFETNLNGQIEKRTYKHQAFELSISWKL